MSNYGPRQLPCPDCGSPVQPDRDQLCPRCGYPLMFLRRPAEDDARAVPRSPDARDDRTGLTSVPPPRVDTRQFSATTYGTPAIAPGQLRCPRCRYDNTSARIRCERCGLELRPARPQPVRLAPPQFPARTRRSGGGWLIALIVLAVLALLLLAATLVWAYWLT
jgi:hypothetical protein